MDDVIPPFIFREYVLNVLQEFTQYFSQIWKKAHQKNKKYQKKAIAKSIKSALRFHKESADDALKDALSKIGFKEGHVLFYPNLITVFVKQKYPTINSASYLKIINISIISLILQMDLSLVTPKIWGNTVALIYVEMTAMLLPPHHCIQGVLNTKLSKIYN